jgi:hypothetical protein
VRKDGKHYMVVHFIRGPCDLAELMAALTINFIFVVSG